MKNATFYLLETDIPVDGLSAQEALVCSWPRPAGEKESAC